LPVYSGRFFIFVAVRKRGRSHLFEIDALTEITGLSKPRAGNPNGIADERAVK
jgi:hypothetical protein